jgi:hypothetical protein
MYNKAERAETTESKEKTEEDETVVDENAF